MKWKIENLQSEKSEKKILQDTHNFQWKKEII